VPNIDSARRPSSALGTSAARRRERRVLDMLQGPAAVGRARALARREFRGLPAQHGRIGAAASRSGADDHQRLKTGSWKATANTTKQPRNEIRGQHPSTAASTGGVGEDSVDSAAKLGAYRDVARPAVENARAADQLAARCTLSITARRRRGPAEEFCVCGTTSPRPEEEAASTRASCRENFYHYDHGRAFKREGLRTPTAEPRSRARV